MSGPMLCKHYNPIDDCCHCLRMRQIDLKNEYHRGRTEERAAIVAWLGDEVLRMLSSAVASERWAADYLQVRASKIAAGDHLKGAKK